MVYYFGKEEIKNYIYENKEFVIQIAEKQYNTAEINKQKIISRILEERKENDIILKAKEEQERKIAEYIENHQKAHLSNIGDMACEGTTPRNITDLIGSLCDLTSGSGDKGTPFVYIQNYFTKWSF